MYSSPLPACDKCQTHRAAVGRQVRARRAHVRLGRLRRDEARRQQPRRRVVHVRDQRACRPAALEPGVRRAVDLHQIAQTLPPRGRLRCSRTARRDFGRHGPSSIIQPRSVSADSRWPCNSTSFSHAKVRPKSRYRSRTRSRTSRRVAGSITLFERFLRIQQADGLDAAVAETGNAPPRPRDRGAAHTPRQGQTPRLSGCRRRRAMGARDRRLRTRSRHPGSTSRRRSPAS